MSYHRHPLHDPDCTAHWEDWGCACVGGHKQRVPVGWHERRRWLGENIPDAGELYERRKVTRRGTGTRVSRLADPSEQNRHSSSSRAADGSARRRESAVSRQQVEALGRSWHASGSSRDEGE